MGYSVYKKGRKPKAGAPRSFTFPLSAELDEEIIKRLHLGPALARFGHQLLKQYKSAGPRPDGAKPTIGISFSEISFSFLLEEPEEPVRS